MSLLENLNKRQQTVEKINLLDQIEANNKKLLDAIKENENLTNKLKSLETQPDSESGKKNEPSGLTKFLSSMFSSGSKPDTTHDTNPELKPNSDLLSAASTAVNSRSSTLQTDDEGVGDPDALPDDEGRFRMRNPLWNWGLVLIQTVIETVGAWIVRSNPVAVIGSVIFWKSPMSCTSPLPSVSK